MTNKKRNKTGDERKQKRLKTDTMTKKLGVHQKQTGNYTDTQPTNKKGYRQGDKKTYKSKSQPDKTDTMTHEKGNKDKQKQKENETDT